MDGEAFLLLSKEDVKDLVKAVGPRTKLLLKRSNLLRMKASSTPVFQIQAARCIARHCITIIFSAS
jgi:hypothetical protein